MHSLLPSKGIQSHILECTVEFRKQVAANEITENVITSYSIHYTKLYDFLFVNISLGRLGFMPSFELLENPKSALATEVYTEDGVLLGTYYYKANRSRNNFV